MRLPKDTHNMHAFSHKTKSTLNVVPLTQVFRLQERHKWMGLVYFQSTFIYKLLKLLFRLPHF